MAAVILMAVLCAAYAETINLFSIYTYIQKPECVRWTWSGDVYNRKVICLEWRKKEPEPEKGKKK